MASDWFPHDYHSRADSAVMQLLCKCNALAYGVFWCVVELLHVNDSLPYESLHKIVGSCLFTDPEAVQKALDSMVELGLLVVVDGSAYSNRVERNKQQRQALTAKRKGAAVRRWSEPMQVQSKSKAKAMQVQSKSNAITLHNNTRVLIGINTVRQHGKARPESMHHVSEYMASIGMDPAISETWFAHYEANGWKVGRNPMKDWKAAVRTWKNNPLQTRTVPNGRMNPGTVTPGTKAPTSFSPEKLDKLAKAAGYGEPKPDAETVNKFLDEIRAK